MSNSERIPECYGCKELVDTFGNFVTCGLLAEQGICKFVDYFYWGSGSPDDCPLRLKESKDE